MNKNIFGTDGVRGIANCGYLTPDYIMKIAIASAVILKKAHPNHHHNKVLIGKDTRLSGYLLENALTAGFVAAGIDVFLVGPMSTPGISMLTKAMRADFGIMISASHNAYQDNGIKIFNSEGFKISPDQQHKISAIIDGNSWQQYLADPSKLGKVKRIDDAQGRYVEFVKSSLPKYLNLEGLRIVIDCANGAAYQLGPTILNELGAEVIAIGNDPTGYNINENCGSTKPNLLASTVVKTRADIGIGLDGDADRLIVIDETGAIINGDFILALIAKSWKKAGRLKNNTIATTIMTNLGCEQYLKQELDINMIRTDVGDSQVMAAMIEHDLNLGGEQSGHIIMNDFAYTGDGLIAAIQVLTVLIESKQKLSQLTKLFVPFPQKISNVSFDQYNPLEDDKVNLEIEKIKTEYQHLNARINVRKSGTEKLIRIMVESPSNEITSQAIDRIIEILNNSTLVNSKV